jgi:hypothetical protein
MVDGDERAGGVAAGERPEEEEIRAAYEAELSRITSADMILQTTVSLINIGGRRLGLTAPGGPPEDAGAAERDLEQVRDAIDGARALLPILERRMPRELGPLRDAIAQLQMAYAREAQSATAGGSAVQAASAAPSPTEQAQPVEGSGGSAKEERPPAPGPAQASGRLWVPGR